MKMKRFLALSLAILLIAALIAGCSAAPMKENMGAADDYYAGEQVKPDGSLNSGSTLDPGVADDRKLIRTISMNTETEDMDALLSAISQQIKTLGGYVESREVYTGSKNTSARRYAKLTIRIPAKSLDDFVAHVDGASNITSTTEDSQDVTLDYVATESHLKVLKAEEERLLKFLSEAKDVSEMLEIEKRLTQVRAELESITSQLNTYDNLVAYGTVHLQISEVKQYTVVEEEDPTLWQRIGDGFMTSLKALGAILEGLLVFFISAIPFLIIPGVILTVVLLIIRKKKR